MVHRIILLSMLLVCISCQEYPVEREAIAQTVYPVPPTGPCTGADWSGTFPGCTVIGADYGAIQFHTNGLMQTSIMGFYSNNAEGDLGGNGDVLIYAPNEANSLGAPGLAYVTGMTTVNNTYTVIAPKSVYQGSLNTQSQLYPGYRFYTQTEENTTSAVFTVPTPSNAVCQFEVTVTTNRSYLTSNGICSLCVTGAGNYGDATSFTYMVGVKNVGGTASSVGVGQVQTSYVYDPSQVTLSLAFTYSGPNMIITGSATDANVGYPYWTMQAWGACD